MVPLPPGDGIVISGLSLHDKDGSAILQQLFQFFKGHKLQQKALQLLSGADAMPNGKVRAVGVP